MALREYSLIRERPSLTQISVLNSFQEVVFSVIHCLPAKDRMKFQAQFEFNQLKPVATANYLLFDAAFPKLHERPLAQLMPQLISHVTGKFSNISRSYFTCVLPDGVPIPSGHPVVVVLDRQIPTDFYARALAHYVPKKSLVLLSIGSFSNQGLVNAEAVRGIVEGCKMRNALFVIVWDELLPDFLIPAIIHYSHVQSFVGYYIIVNEIYFDKIPIIPNAQIVTVAKPVSMAGASRLLAQFPSFRGESQRFEFPLLYLEILLTHRDDFPIGYNHLLPMAAATRDLWMNAEFPNPKSRSLWLNIIHTLWRTMTPSVLVKNALYAVLHHFFKDITPSIPTVVRIDLENDTLFSSEFPPPAGECGMMIGLSDYEIREEDRVAAGWQPRIAGKWLAVGEIEGAVMTIEKARLVNGRYKDDEITIFGEKELTLSVLETEPPDPRGDTDVLVYDGRELVGKVRVKCPGNKEMWTMSAVHIVLPTKLPRLAESPKSPESEEVSAESPESPESAEVSAESPESPEVSAESQESPESPDLPESPELPPVVDE
jgi:hypothetical protein